MNIGNFQWDQRWKYSDQADDLPGSQKLPSATSTLSGTGTITREGGNRDMYRSTYAVQCSDVAPAGSTMREAKSTCDPENFKSMRDLRARERGTKKGPEMLRHHLDPYPHLSEEEKAKFTPEERSWRMWSRVNPAYSVTPYTTETQRNYHDHSHAQRDIDPMQTSHHMQVRDKAYKEACQKQLNITKSIAAARKP